MMLMRLNEEYAENLRASGNKIQRSAFPKSKDAWYTVILDDTYTDATVKKLLDDAYDQAK